MQLPHAFLRTLITAFVFSSCIANVQAADQLAQGFTALPTGAKVVIMPMDVELFSMSAGGVLEPQAEWTNQALNNLKLAATGRQKKDGAAFNGFPGEPDTAIDELNRLHGAVGSALSLHHVGPFKLPTKEGRLEWTLGPDVGLIKQKTGADYALFTFIRDSYATAERKAAIVVAAIFGVGLTAGFQVGYASLVDLTTGDVMWFNQLVRGYGDLREPEPAKESLDALLKNFPG